MNILYAPWRSSYSESTDHSKDETATTDECVFCTIIQSHDDTQNFVLKRTDHTIIILNLFPYNAGHILVLPLDHVADLAHMSQDGRRELIELTSSSIELIKQELKPNGFNTGINLGRAAGAGIPSHLHMHVLPRWQGDTNFLPTLAQTKQISFDLRAIYDRLKPHFDRLTL